MSTRLYGILTDGLNKPIVNATVALLAKGNTITVLNGSEAVFRTDGEGAYNVTVQAGHYKVIIGPQGLEPYKAGEIIIYSDSPEGSLNGYLINWAPEELTPDVIKQVQQLVANSEEYALQAGRSAAAANADATDARNSKASAAQSASDALVYKNDAKDSEDAAKQAQAGAAGSANTASQAVTLIEGLKSDVEQLKVDTQGIKNSAVSETQSIKDNAVLETTALKDAAAASAAQASNSATEAGQQASNAAGSAQSASTDAERAEVAAGKAEGVLSQALLKDNNLSDVSDLDITRSNLKVDKLVQETEHTFLYTDDKRYRLSIGSGEIVFQHDTDGQNNWTTVPFPVDIGGTGASTASEARTNLDVPANNEALLVENNLQDLADRAAAWMNVRPVGSTPLAADPSDDLDATTKRWVENHVLTTVGDGYNAISDSWTVPHNDEVAPEIGAAVKGGDIRSDYNIAGSMHLRSSMRAEGNYGQRGCGVWRVEDSIGNSNEIIFTLSGDVLFPLPITANGKNILAISTPNPDGTWPTVSPWVGCQLTSRVPNSGFNGAQFNMYVQENVGVDAFGGLIFIGANTTQAWLFNQFGNAIAPGLWVSNSDRRIKKDIARIEDPLNKMRKIHGYSWRRLEGNQFGVGFIAQEVQELFPESVYEGPSRTMPDGTVVEGVLSPDTSGVAAALHHEAILALMDQIEELKQEIAVLKASMQTLP